VSFDRSDFDALNKEREKQRLEQLAPQLRLMQQAAILAELLPGVPAWDVFLSYIQGAVETTRAQAATLEAVLKAADLLDPQRLLEAKVSLLRCHERIAAWEAVIQLPKDLINQGDQAESLVSRMEKGATK